MAFGKITVLTAGGDTEEYELTKPTTSVGRQPGNDIVLRTSAVSRYHAQFEVAEGSVWLVDQGGVNGTFVNDAQLEPNSRVPLSDGDVIMLGDVVMRFQSPGERGVRRAALSLTPEAVPVERAGLPFRLVLDEPQQPVAPGARLQLALLVENLTDRELPVVIDVGGLEPEWLKVNRREVTLEPREQAQAMISVRPPRSSHTRPGVYALTVHVAHQNDAHSALEAIREIEVVSYAGLGMALRGSRSDDVYHLAVQNHGNVPAEIQLRGYQRDKLLRFRFNPARLSLGPGETRQATLTVQRARRGPVGSTQEIEFAVVAHSLDAAGFQAPLAATHTLKPSWPRWLLGAGVPMLLGALVVLAVIAAGLLYVGLLPWPFGASPFATPVVITSVVQPTVAEALAPSGPTPTQVPTPQASIDVFTATPPEVIYRTAGLFRLEWQVWGAQELTLLGPGDVPIPLSEENLGSERIELPTEELAYGDNAFTLTVTGADGQPRTRTVVVTAKASFCTVEVSTPVYSAPDPEADAAPPLTANQVVIMGRTADLGWLRVSYNDLTTLSVQGWVEAGVVTCAPEAPPLGRYLVLRPDGTPDASPAPSPPGPRAPLTPTPKP